MSSGASPPSPSRCRHGSYEPRFCWYCRNADNEQTRDYERRYDDFWQAWEQAKRDGRAGDTAHVTL